MSCSAVENILVFAPPGGPVEDPFLHPDKLHYKISDLGSARVFDDSASTAHTFIGTTGPYMAPEVFYMALRMDAAGDHGYGPAVDVWALGMLWLQIR